MAIALVPDFAVSRPEPAQVAAVTFAGGPGFEYQLPMIEAALTAIRRGDKEVLIAATPNAGKTNMAFEIVRRLVESADIDQALVLAWMRTGLKKQWINRMGRDAPALVKHLSIDIPQQRRNIKGKVDLLIQDEGHQGYEVEAGMVQDIRSRVRARTTLILTGSPSVFIKRGLKPAAVFSLEELHAAGRASDLTIEIGTSSYNLLDKHFNEKGDVTIAGRKLQTQRATNDTLERLLDGLHARLKLSHRSMDSAWNRVQLRGAKRKTWWARILTGLKKSIIACNDIEQAEQVAGYFGKQGVKVFVSHGGNDKHPASDKDSGNIDLFETSDHPLLVVVDRAQLGYDNPELVNFIDMTGSRNPDRIFQMLCRVVRVSKSNPKTKKLFVKVMPASFSDQNLLFFMEGVLNLSRREIFETYDGTGFYRGPVPGRPGGPCGPRRKVGGQEKPGDEIVWSPVLEPGMSLYGPTGYFTAIAHTNADGYEAIGQVRLGDLLNLRMHDSNHKMGLILEWFDRTGQWPKTYRLPKNTNEREENVLRMALLNYTRKASQSYCAEFANQVQLLGWSIGMKGVLKQKLIVAFFEANGRWPDTKHDRKERLLLGLLSHYVEKDPAFNKRVRDLGWMPQKERTDARCEDAIHFHIKNGRWPQASSKVQKEARLGQFLSKTKGGHQSWMPAFRARCAKLDPKRFGEKK